MINKEMKKEKHGNFAVFSLYYTKTGLFDKLRFNFADMPCRRLVRAVIFWGNVFERFESFDKIAKIVKTAIVGDLRDGKIAAQKFSRGAFDTICH